MIGHETAPHRPKPHVPKRRGKYAIVFKVTHESLAECSPKTKRLLVRAINEVMKS
jgi:hypothetical protein